jgi:glycosyltransferase involved in cell wall biosynthesis
VRSTLRVGVEATSYNNVRAGIARYLHCMVSEMLSQDPDVEFVFYAPRDADLVLEPGRWRLRKGLGPCGSVGNLWVQRQVPKWAAEDRLDVFWGQNHMLPLQLRRPCFRLLTVHDLAILVCPETMALRSVLSRRLFTAAACRTADVVLTVSDATAASLVRLLGVKPKKITRVYEGVDESMRPVPAACARELAAAKYGLTGDYLLTVGTIEPRKDHGTLLRALRHIPNAPILVIVGGVGWKAGAIVEEIAAMERAGRVRRLGWVDDSDLPALYSAAEVMVFPSLFEGFGLPVLEAMACGCPILCSWSSSLPELYFHPGDSEDLARRLVALLSDDGKRAAMSSAGVARAGQFSFAKAAAEVLGIMRQGAAQRR